KSIRTFGVVRGITVRSRSIFGTLGGTFQTIVGGNITAFTKLCETARAEAFEIMIQHASEIGANAIIGMRYDANEIMNGVTEVLAYGTAVVVAPVEPEGRAARAKHRLPGGGRRGAGRHVTSEAGRRRSGGRAPAS